MNNPPIVQITTGGKSTSQNPVIRLTWTQLLTRKKWLNDRFNSHLKHTSVLFTVKIRGSNPHTPHSTGLTSPSYDLGCLCFAFEFLSLSLFSQSHTWVSNWVEVPFEILPYGWWRRDREASWAFQYFFHLFSSGVIAHILSRFVFLHQMLRSTLTVL